MKMELSNAGNNIQTQFRFFLNIVILDVLLKYQCSHFSSMFIICYIFLWWTITLWARDFYEVKVDEAEGQINYHLIDIESK